MQSGGKLRLRPSAAHRVVANSATAHQPPTDLGERGDGLGEALALAAHDREQRGGGFALACDGRLIWREGDGGQDQGCEKVVVGTSAAVCKSACTWTIWEARAAVMAALSLRGGVDHTRRPVASSRRTRPNAHTSS